MESPEKKGKIIFEYLLSKDQAGYRKAYKILRDDPNVAIFPMIYHTIIKEMNKLGIKQANVPYWPDDVFNRMFETMWKLVQSGKFLYQYEKGFWQFLHRIWKYTWYDVLRKFYHKNKQTFSIIYFPPHQLAWFYLDQMEEIDLLDAESIFLECFHALPNRAKTVLEAYWACEGLQENDVIEYMRTNHPGFKIPKAGLRMIKSRSEKTLRHLVNQNLRAA